MEKEKEIERSLMFPALHPVNLKQVKQALKAKGFAPDGIWFHGCGNFYTSEKESNDRATFHNDHPFNKGAKYRVHLEDESDVPATLAILEANLLKAQQAEEREKSLETMRKSTNEKAFDFVDDEDEPATDDGAAAFAAVQKKLGKSKSKSKEEIPPVDPSTEPVV